ncbi:ankyrin repeat domain protein [Trichonephila clavata]|uniref:Ankyrin repeat domain protein n=1 Tax=Trichonephila clavata TaxID=2740835 RepID=A0A8X6LY10_TRICU|nr:ankyrin repeat domain protein [Trichonephila clavata]
MGWNLFGGLIPPTANHTEEKEHRHSGDSGTEEEFEILERGEIKERRYSGDSEFQLTQSLLSQVKADENNENVKSGGVAYKDLHRMNFVINGQEIDRNFINKLHADLIKNDKGKKNYRLFAKYVFIKMFKHAKAEVPDDHILEELITSCNQAGYLALLPIQMHNILKEYQLSLNDPDKETIYIDCSDENCVSINYKSSIIVRNDDDPEKEICELGSSLEFTLRFQNGKVEYENGKVTLTIPEQLKDYKVGRKSLLGVIV